VAALAGLSRWRAANRIARAVAFAVVAVVALAALALASDASAQHSLTISRIKPSIVAIGTFQATRVPQFRFAGTGFAVGDGTLAATNAHVIPTTLDGGADPEQLVAVLPASDASGPAMRRLSRVLVDAEHDLALLKMEGAALRPMKVRDSSSVAEGDELLFTGFPIGSAIGLFPATHRALVAAIAPVALPSASGRQLDPKVIRRLRDSVFPIFQLDATAFPGNSGSPLYDPASGEVVGVVNMVFVKGTKEAALSHPSGISYAMPSRYLLELLGKARP